MRVTTSTDSNGVSMSKQSAGKEFDVNRIRQDFPILKRKVNGKPLIYLDNAATTQKPISVIKTLSDYYESCNSNIHRAVHDLSEIATERYEDARKKTRSFINAASPKEIVFTKNATEAINLIAYSLGTTLKKGDEIVSTVMEHHSNIVPWQMLESRGVKIRYVDIDDDGKLEMEQYKKLITKKTRIVTVTQMSNVLGTINDVKHIAKIAHESGAVIAVDGAQSVPHMPVDVRDLDIDFLAFSGHKMLGPTGVGVLYGKKELLEKMQPFLRGGDMIKEVSLKGTVFGDTPLKFEAGTSSIADVIALGTAIDYLSSLGMKNVRKHGIELTEYALKRLSEIRGIKIYGPESTGNKSGIVSFNIEGIHSHDVASIVNDSGIAIRSGHSCAMPLMKRLGCSTAARASFYIYNTKNEIDKLANALEKAKKIFRV